MSDKSGSGPATLCNRFYISVGPYGVRLAFAEQYSKESNPLFRSAVVMPHSNAIQMAKALKEMLDPIEKWLGPTEDQKDA